MSSYNLWIMSKTNFSNKIVTFRTRPVHNSLSQSRINLNILSRSDTIVGGLITCLISCND